MKTQVLKFSCKVYVRESYFTGEDEYEGEKMLKCKIISVSCYPNQQITFDLLVENSYIYSNVSVEELYAEGRQPIQSCPFDKSYDYVCGPNNDCEIFQYPFTEQYVFSYYKGDRYCGNYCFSIEMVDDNELFHFIKLVTGHCILIPSHKLSLTEVVDLPKYIKNTNYASK